MNQSCPNCDSFELVQNDAQGELVCENCGCVCESNTMVQNLEFVENSGGGSSMVGQFVSATGRAFSQHLGGGQYNLTNKEPGIVATQNGKRMIQLIAQSMHLSQHFIDSAVRLYELAIGKNFIKGRRIKHVSVACLYCVCRRDNAHYLLMDFSEAVHENVHVLGKVFAGLCKLLNLQFPIVDPSLFIHRFASRLGLGEKTHQISLEALQYVKQMKRDWIHSGRRPSGVCSAALLIAARTNGCEVSFQKMAEVAKISVQTIETRLKEFSLTEASDQTPEEFGKKLISESDPPSFVRARMLENAAKDALLLEDKLKRLEDGDDSEDDTAHQNFSQSNDRLRVLTAKALPRSHATLMQMEKAAKEAEMYADIASELGLDSDEDEVDLPSKEEVGTTNAAKQKIIANTIRTQHLREAELEMDALIDLQESSDEEEVMMNKPKNNKTSKESKKRQKDNDGDEKDDKNSKKKKKRRRVTRSSSMENSDDDESSSGDEADEESSSNSEEEEEEEEEDDNDDETTNLTFEQRKQKMNATLQRRKLSRARRMNLANKVLKKSRKAKFGKQNLRNSEAIALLARETADSMRSNSVPQALVPIGQLTSEDAKNKERERRSAFEVTFDDEISVSDISDDDEDVNDMILSDEQQKQKDTVWEKINNDYLVKQRQRDADIEAGLIKPRKRREKIDEERDPNLSAADAASQILAKKARLVSKKLNYNAIESLKSLFASDEPEQDELELAVGNGTSMDEPETQFKEIEDKPVQPVTRVRRLSFVPNISTAAAKTALEQHKKAGLISNANSNKESDKSNISSLASLAAAFGSGSGDEDEEGEEESKVMEMSPNMLASPIAKSGPPSRASISAFGNLSPDISGIAEVNSDDEDDDDSDEEDVEEDELLLRLKRKQSFSDMDEGYNEY